MSHHELTRLSDFVDKFIAYIDILGFKKLVSDVESGCGMPLPQLLGILKCFGTGNERERLNNYGPACCPTSHYLQRNLDFRLTQVSDCAVISAEVSPAGVINLLCHCWGVVMEFMQHGIMCRGYIKRGLIYHTEQHILGTGYQDVYIAEQNVAAFKHEADERGTPFVEVDSSISNYISANGDACVKEMFSRFVKKDQDGSTAALFPFKRIQHSFIIAGLGYTFDAERELRSNQNVRTVIHKLKERIELHTDKSNESAVKKVSYYLAALDDQLIVCDRAEEMLNKLHQHFPNPRSF